MTSLRSTLPLSDGLISSQLVIATSAETGDDHEAGTKAVSSMRNLIYFPKHRLPRFRRYDSDVPDLDPHDPIGPADPFYDGPTAEDFIPSPPKPRSPLSYWPDVKALRPVLLLFAIFWAISIGDWRAPNAYGHWASGQAVFDKGEWWRLLTALFAHSDVGHLAANSPLFLIFGWYLCAYFGVWAFPGAALVVGVLSNLATIYFYPPGSQLLGASGMLYGMVALWLVLYVRFEPSYSVGMRAFRAIGVSLLLLFPTTFEKSTSYLAHATGFGIGVFAGLVLAPILAHTNAGMAFKSKEIAVAVVSEVEPPTLH